jgi:hypothetical protein
VAEGVQKIYARAEASKESGRDPFLADWQAVLEIMLFMIQEPLLQSPGQLLPMQISGQEEWEFYVDVRGKLDLPPETCAVLMTPSAFRDMPVPKIPESERTWLTPWERNTYGIIVSNLHDREVVMHVSLPGIESVGIDVYEDGKHLADYTYNTTEECLDDLAKVVWIYFNPKGDWTKEQIIRYTENWYAKSINFYDIDSIKVHAEHTYVHHPELIGLSSLEAVFKVVVATIPKEYDSLDKAIEIANDVNQDMDLGYDVITREGIVHDDKAECQALLTRLVVEIDQHLDKLK